MKNSKKDTFRVKISRKVEKFLDKLSKKDRERILKVLRTLRDNPFALDIKKLEGTDFHRIRVGKHFRIIIYIDWENKAIIVFKIDKRERIYDRI